jgi:hypothetical protein
MARTLATSTLKRTADTFGPLLESMGLNVANAELPASVAQAIRFGAQRRNGGRTRYDRTDEPRQGGTHKTGDTARALFRCSPTNRRECARLPTGNRYVALRASRLPTRYLAKKSSVIAARLRCLRHRDKSKG